MHKIDVVSDHDFRTKERILAISGCSTESDIAVHSDLEKKLRSFCAKAWPDWDVYVIQFGKDKSAPYYGPVGLGDFIYLNFTSFFEYALSCFRDSLDKVTQEDVNDYFNRLTNTEVDAFKVLLKIS